MRNATVLRGLTLSRRRLLMGALGLGLGGALLRGGATPVRAAPQGPKHLVWVWQFSIDAAPNFIGAKLRDHGLGLVLKTHDGLEWMSEYDKSPFAVTGPAQVAVLANYFESAGVPFHAWAVIQGGDPVREARMAADVLGAGARSIYLDVEPHSGFWRGSSADAEAYGRELHRLRPDGRVVLSVDPRPWMIDRLPMQQFAAFASEIAPQQYWRTFNTPANHTRFAASGFPVPPEGITPEFLIGVTKIVLSRFGLPVTHVGQGATPDPDEWRRFIDLAYGEGSNIVTVWRYGVTTQAIFSLLRDTPPRLPAPSSLVYVVQPGDTLGAIAAAHGVSIDSIVQANNLDDPNYLYVGQELKIPGAGGTAAAPGRAATSSPSSGGGGRTYTVQPGDTLYAIAGKYGATVEAIAGASGITNPDFISIGQQLIIP